MHAREVDAGALEECAVLEHAGGAAAAFRALPAIRDEASAIGRLERGDDARLHAGEEIVHRSPEKIMKEIAALDAKSAEVLGNIKALL